MSSFPLDFSYGMCIRKLRSLELLAYSSVVTSLRAQGSLTSEKKKLLQELQSVLHIPLPIHKAEMRRVVNCQILRAIAERTEGPNTASEWTMEGRRLCPLIKRARVETEYTRYADEIVKAYKAEVAKQLSKAKDPCSYEDLQADRCNWTGVQTDVEEIENDIDSIMKPQISAESAIPKKDIRGGKKGEKRKLSESAEINDSSCKMMAVDSPSEEFSSKQSLSEDTIEMATTDDTTLCPTPVSKANGDCINDNKEPSETEIIPKPSKLRFSVPSKSLFASNSTVQLSVSFVNPVRSSTPKTVTAPSPAPTPNQLEISDSVSTVTATCNVSKNPLVSESASCSVSASVVNSVTTPVFSVSVDNSLATTNAPVNVTETKTKLKMLPLSAKLVRPKLTQSNINIGSPALLNLPSSLRHPSPSTVNNWPKSVLSLKPNSSSTSVISTSSRSIQVTSASTNFKRPQSPIILTKFGLSTTNTPQLKSPLTLKYCPTKISDSSSKEAVQSGLAKGLTKSSSSVSALGTKTVSQSPASSKITPPEVIATWKPSNIPKVLTSAKISGSPNMPQKLLVTPISTKPAPITRHVQFGTDGGVKIISANTSNHPIPSKSGTSTSETIIISTTAMTTTSASMGLTKNAKILSLTGPIKLDRKNNRFNLYSTSASKSVSTPGVHVCSTPPVATFSGRPVLPAKPNVIVVHKAQILPQTSAAASVLPPPTGTASQLSEKDTIHSIPNNESGNQANATIKQKIFSVVQSSHVITSTASKTSSVPSTPTNTISLTAENMLKEKKIERHSSIKLPGTGQAITLIERKILGSSPVSSPENIKLPIVNQQAPILCGKAPLSVKTAATFPNETANRSKTNIECSLQQSKGINPGEDSSLIRRPSEADNNNCHKRLKLSVSVVDKLQSKKKNSNGSDVSMFLKDTVLQQTDVENDCKANTCNEDENKAVLENNLSDCENASTAIPNMDSIPIVNIQGILLDHQLQDGESLTMQPQEAMDFLKKHGQWNNKIITSLKRAGIQIKEGEQALALPVVDNENSNHAEGFLLSTEVMSDSFEEVECQEDGSDIK